jgi:CubicO group peptidase (beta-lactamase class C family)
LVFVLPACFAPNPQKIIGQIDAYLTEFETDQGFRGAVLIAKEGNILLSKGYGMADVENQIPNTPQTRYRISWLTAPFTAMAVMQLQEDGKLDAQDEICEYISECPEYWNGITLHHLLTHTSGVADEKKTWESEAEKPKTGMERVELIKGVAPYFQPGEQLRYSINGYIILGAIIEQVSGQPYDEYLEAHIFGPLGMENTGFEGNGIAVGYGPTRIKVPDPDIIFRYSATGLYSTVEDLYLWDQALYGEELIQQEFLDMMFTGYALTPSVDFPDARYGYGWFIHNMYDRRLIFHGGAMSGYSSGIMRFPDERVTIIVLRNYEMEIYDRLEIEMAEMVFGENE